MATDAEKMRELGEMIITDPDKVEELSEQELTEMRKYLNPIGGIVGTKKTYVNMSIINWQERYLRRLLMTAQTGYLYRTLEEYEPEEDLAASQLIFDRKTSHMDKSSAEYARLAAAHAEEQELIKKAARVVVRRFLNRNFNYNPDYHLRGSHSGNKSDPEREPKADAIRRVCKTASAAPEIESKLSAKRDLTYQFLREKLLTTYQMALQLQTDLKNTIRVLMDPVAAADQQGILLKKYKQLTNIVADMRKIAEPLAAADTLNAWEVDPPVDVFHQFDRYLTNHYEQLREVCTALYNERPDFEFGVTVHSAHKTADAARNYRIQHESEFRTEVFAVESGAVTLIGPFKENRQRVDFFNKNTEIMKRMMEQIEADHKLGKDLMEKQVRNKKRKNIEEAGPDNPALATYAKAMNTVQELGARKTLTREEQDKLAAASDEARKIKEDYEVPEDAIQVDMFYPTTAEDGSVGLARTKFYSQAEAPLHMQEGSEYTEQYQPKRATGKSLKGSYKTKTVTARDGKQMEIRVPKSKRK